MTVMEKNNYRRAQMDHLGNLKNELLGNKQVFDQTMSEYNMDVKVDLAGTIAQRVHENRGNAKAISEYLYLYSQVQRSIEVEQDPSCVVRYVKTHSER